MKNPISPFVSIIMAAYNAEKFIQLAINSVLSQSFQNWELLVVNDGSTDNSKDIILSFQDTRIKYFEQENRGVSEARNVGLKKMTCNFFCFLDADDILTPNSLETRLAKFSSNKSMSFVDGPVVFFDDATNNVVRKYIPRFRGQPLKELFKLNGTCFACPSWMIKRDPSKEYSMKQGLTHGEDLLFFMELARNGGEYDYVDEDILYYRQHSQSAMKNVSALEKSYWQIFNDRS